MNKLNNCRHLLVIVNLKESVKLITNVFIFINSQAAIHDSKLLDFNVENAVTTTQTLSHTLLFQTFLLIFFGEKFPKKWT